MATAKTFEQVVVSDTNRAPIIQIFTWLALTLGLLAFVTHVSIKLWLLKALKVEAWLVLGSMIFCVAQSAVVLQQTAYGFGKPIKMLSERDLQAVFKCEYAAMILFVFSLGFSKLAVIAFIHELTPNETHRAINFGVGILSSLWLVSSTFVAAFQCSMPDPWNRLSGHCLNRLTWWTAVSALNMGTEVIIVGLELAIAAALRTPLRRMIKIMSLFAFRLLVPIAVLIQLIMYYKESRDSSSKDDLTIGYWRSTICQQLVQGVAILTTCLPYTKIFLEGFDSGLMRVDELRRRGEHTGKDESSGYQLMDISRSTQPSQLHVSRSWDSRSDRRRTPAVS